MLARIKAHTTGSSQTLIKRTLRRGGGGVVSQLMHVPGKGIGL